MIENAWVESSSLRSTAEPHTPCCVSRGTRPSIYTKPISMENVTNNFQRSPIPRLKWLCRSCKEKKPRGHWKTLHKLPLPTWIQLKWMGDHVHRKTCDIISDLGSR